MYIQVSKNKSTRVPILSSATGRNLNVQSNGRSRCVGDQFLASRLWNTGEVANTNRKHLELSAGK